MGRRKKGAARKELVFDEEKRKEFLTGFHKRKVQRRKAAVEEIKTKIKLEQKKMREERHKEYMKMLKEREEALEEADEIERLVTSKTESIVFDHPSHTVTVTTISDLDLSGVGLLPPGTIEDKEEKNEEEQSRSVCSLPKKSWRAAAVKEDLQSQQVSPRSQSTKITQAPTKITGQEANASQNNWTYNQNSAEEANWQNWKESRVNYISSFSHLQTVY